MVSVWTLTGTFRRRRRVLGVDACLMRFYDPAMQKKSICNLRHLFKNITEFGVWYKYDVFGHFAFVLQMSVMWTHRSRTEDTFRVWNLFTARRQERFILFFYITDLYVWIPRIFKITFCKCCCDRGAEASCLRTETEPELRQLRRGGRIHCLSFSSPVDFSFMILLRCRISADNVAAVGLRMCQMKWVWSFQDVTFYQSDVLAAECDDQIILPTNIHFLHFSDFL